MSKLGALFQNIKVVAEEKPRNGGGPRKEWNPPAGLTIRVWKDGSVFPSQELVDKFDLAYRNKATDAELAALKEAGKLPVVGHGFDIVDSSDFAGTFATPTRLLVISPARKDAGKVDIFDSVSFKEDGTPIASVMDQGSTTFGKKFLIPKIEEIYEVIFAKSATAKTGESGALEPTPAVEGVDYVDLVLIGQEGEISSSPQPWTLPDGKVIAYFPKIMTKGDNKGQMTVARRENPKMYVLYPKQLLLEEEQAPKEVAPVASAQ